MGSRSPTRRANDSCELRPTVFDRRGSSSNAGAHQTGIKRAITVQQRVDDAHWSLAMALAWITYRCPSRKSYPHVAMMQSGQDLCGDDGPRPLDGSP